MQRQHFVPQFYLGGFTDSGTKRGWFCVPDYDAQVSGWSTPKDVAHTSNFNELSVGADPLALEKGLSAFESKAAMVIQNIRKSNQTPPDGDLNYVINLITMLWVRNPRFGSTSLGARERAIRVAMDMLASDRMLYESHVRSAKNSGFVQPHAELTFEEFRATRDQYEIRFPPDSNFKVEFDAFETTLQYFGARYWSLLKAASEAPDFSTCDHPVSIVPKRSISARVVGAATAQTECCFPLTSRLALIGVFEDPEESVQEVEADRIANFNTVTANNAARYLYAKDTTIAILHDGEVLNCPLPCYK